MMLPNGWQETTIGAVVEIHDARRQPLNSEQRALFPGGFPYYGANGQVDTVGGYLFDGDYALLAEDGGYFDERHRGVAYRAQGKFWVNNHAHVLAPLGGMETPFIVLALNAIDWMPYVSGTTRLKLTQGKLVDVPIQIPPLDEQKRIVAKIEELTARSRRAKTALDAVPPLLDQLRQSILAAAFRGDLTADWRAKNPNVEPADKLLARIRAERRVSRKNSPPMWVTSPEVMAVMAPHFEVAHSLRWECSSLEDLCDSDRPITYGIVQTGEQTPGGVPTVRCGDIKGFNVDVHGLKLVDRDIEAQYPRTRLLGGEVLVAIRGTVGGVAVASSELNGANISREVAMLAVLPGIDPHYLTLALASPLGKELLSLHTKGVAQSGVNIGDLRAFPLLVPPLAEQIEIVRRVRGAFDHVERLAGHLRQSQHDVISLDQAILAKAFRGELVPQDPNDEPTSVLLERIRVTRAETAAGAPRRRAQPTASSTPVDHDESAASEAPPARTPRRGRAPASSAAVAPDAAPRRRRGRPTSPDTTVWPPDAPESPTVLVPARRAAADLDPDTLPNHTVTALWPHGPLEKDVAVRRLADHLRQAGLVDYQRLRADGPLYAQLLAAVESAVKAGLLDRPGRGLVRACRADPTAYTTDDWRHALLATLPTTPTDREEAIRAAAEWARDQLGLEYARLRGDGHIVTGLRSAINSAIRRGEVARHGADQISRVGGPTQLDLLGGAEPGRRSRSS